MQDKGKFCNVGINEDNAQWWACIKRPDNLYKRDGEIRSEFKRDYDRILHCTAYRRLKHKTQVFFNPTNDHICTRIEHVNHVASVSYTISKYLGLNTELTNAIAIGHDLGHAPFGHAGENFLKEIACRELKETFWHEKNSLRFVDKCETMPDPNGKEINLNLTYATRDGIVCHCGEVDETAVFPRKEILDLNEIQEAGKYAPFTWEACVVKIADKISYLGRDIEDAMDLKILTKNQIAKLKIILRNTVQLNLESINNTKLINDFILDLCKESSPENGIRFSEKYLHLINEIKQFNYKNIYDHKRLRNYKEYAKLVIDAIFNELKLLYDEDRTMEKVEGNRRISPLLIGTFLAWLEKYSNLYDRNGENNKYDNKIIYHFPNENDYKQAIIDFMSGMTDNFAIRIFNQIIYFG